MDIGLHNVIVFELIYRLTLQNRVRINHVIISAAMVGLEIPDTSTVAAVKIAVRKTIVLALGTPRPGRVPKECTPESEKSPKTKLRTFSGSFRTPGRTLWGLGAPRDRRPRDTLTDCFRTLWGFHARRAREPSVPGRGVPIQGEIIYAPPPSPHFWPKGIVQGRGVGVYIFQAPRGRNFIRPPFLYTPHP